MGIEIIDVLFLLFVIICVFVYLKKKIPVLSLYTIFILQTIFYFIFHYLFVRGANIGVGLGHWGGTYSKEVYFYFFAFNILFMTIFCLIYYLFKDIRINNLTSAIKDKYCDYNLPLFVLLLFLSTIYGILSLKYTYSAIYANTLGGVSSILANISNIMAGLFILYMLMEKNFKRINIMLLLTLFSLALSGRRLFMLLIAVPYIAYMYDLKRIKTKHLVVIFLAVALLLTAVASFRRHGGFEMDYFTVIYAASNESMTSSGALFDYIDRWQKDSIVYYTWFSNYLIDPVLIWVPNVIFSRSGVNKAEYNTATRWIEDNKLGPNNYYLSDAFMAGGVYGIMIMAAIFALLCVGFERIKTKGLGGSVLYYCFLSVFSTTIVSERFSESFKYFSEELLAVVVFMLLATFFIKVIKEIKQNKT